MLRLVLRRMFSSRWMIICLLIGSIMVTALVSCIPIYTDGILQRMLTKDLENYQIEQQNFPGEYHIKSRLYYNYEAQDRVKAFALFNNRFTNKFVQEYNLPVLSSSVDLTLGNFSIPVKPSSGYANDSIFVQLGALSDMEKHVKITNGRLFTNHVNNGAYEVIVSQQALKDLKLVLDREYTLLDIKDKPLYKVKVVGVYAIADERDIYWYKNLTSYSNTFMMSYELLDSEFIQRGTEMLLEAEWFFGFDYHKMTLQNIFNIIEVYKEQAKWSEKYRGSIELKMPAISIIEKYHERSNQLKTMLWVLAIPVLIMLTFYIFMVSQLIINHDENGIAVLKSRGASRGQIFLSYLMESSVIGVIAFIFGPPAGMLICRFLGASNGFMEFVQRTALPLQLNTRVYSYSLAAVAFLIITMLIPVIISSRMSIISYKQGRARSSKTTLWKKYFLDILILAASGYGIYRYNQQQKILSTTGVKASELSIDPLLFLTSTLFVLGAGLLFLRLYPYLIRLVYWLGRRIWSPVMYVSLIQVGRSKGQEQFLMLFIILAISTGIFNANSARTINKNIEDKIKYSIGADVTLMAVWKDNQPKDTGGPPQGMGGASVTKKEPLRYYEPEYKLYSDLSGSQYTTKVLVNKEANIQNASKWVYKIEVMGIIPDEFAKVAWFRPDLLPHHWYNYLNLMSGAPKAFLLSSNLKEKYEINEGDTIYLSWGEQSYLEGTVYAFVDYWPTYNPGSTETGGLVVANLSYIQNKLAVQPYEVWIKKKPGATDKQINDDIAGKQLDISEVKYTNQQMIKMKNDPMLQGLNGAQTLGFISAMVISTLGFLIYWIISIQSRILQFGIFRAMGLSLTKVIGMLACEQVLVSGAAIVTGLMIGGIAGDTFIPLLQIVYSSVEQVPPFKIIANGSDYIKIYAVICTMLVIGFLTLWRLISKIRIDQAVKLGED